MQDVHILGQTGENLTLLGHCQIPELSLTVGVSPKFSEYSLRGKLEKLTFKVSPITQCYSNGETLVSLTLFKMFLCNSPGLSYINRSI